MAEKTKQVKNEELIGKLNKWWRLADSDHTQWETQAKRDLDFYLGKQWDSADLEKLTREGRPALTFNRIRAPINLVSGYERQNRRDIKAINKKGGSRVMAEVLTKLIKDVMDSSNGDYEKSHAFWKGIITSRGWLSLNLDFEKDLINGDLILEELSPFKVRIDPFVEKYDMSDAMFIFKIAWLPKDKIEQTFPDKKDELANLNVIEVDRQSIDYGDEYRDSTNTSTGGEVKEYKYRVKECWWRDYKKTQILINTETGMTRDVTELPTDKVKRITDTLPKYRVIERVKKVLHLTVYVGNVMLQDIEDPFNGVTTFPIVPFFAYWIEGEWRSLVTDLQDPQQEVNKRRSQLLHHLNQSANSGWMGDEDAVTDWSDVEDFGSKPGVIIKVRKGKKLERITPASISEGHLLLAKEADIDIKLISGINADLLGITPEKHESGIAMQLRQRQGNITIESLFDNMRFTDKLLGKLLIDMIQRSGAYSREEMVKIVVDDKEQEVAVNKKVLSEFGAIKKIENDLSIGQYDITVTSSPSMPTVRLANLHAMLEMVKQGFPVPPDLIIEQSDIPNKEQIKERMKAAQPQISKEELESKFREKELALKTQLETKKLEQEAQLKREEFELKVELKRMEIAAKVKTSK